MRRRRPGDGHDPGAPQLTVAVTPAQLDALIEEEPRLLLVYFWRPGCQPCRLLRPQLEGAVAAAAGLVTAAAVDLDRHPQARLRYGVGAAPTVAFFRGGAEVHRFSGGALPADAQVLLA